MKHTVLESPGLAGHAKRFVWVALDTDKEANAEALKKYPVSAWPTFFVIGPNGQVAAQFLGSASVKQFREFLDQGEAAARTDAPADSLIGKLRAADQASSAQNYKKAAANYRAALKAAPPHWSRRPDVLVSYISTLFKAGDQTGCAKLGEQALESTLAAKSASTADFASYANQCANNAFKAKRLEKFRNTSIQAIKTLLTDPMAALSADDRSDGWRIIREIELARGHQDAAKEAAKKQQAILDQAAAAADNPFFAMTYNWPRAEVYVYLGEADKLVDPLKASTAALPKEYDPPYRLAWVLLKLKRYDEARKAAQASAALVYGPRKARVLSVLADIEKADGHIAAAKAALNQAIRHLQSLPEGQQRPAAMKRITVALKALK